MKFDNDTVNVLKNFSLINPSIAFKPGNVLATMSPQKSIMARARITDEFPSEGAIYDLGRFLGVVSLFDKPDFSFNPNYMDISDGKHNVSYTFADASMIITPTKESIDIPDPDLDIYITNEMLSNVLRAANVMSLPEICIRGHKDISIQAVDSNNPTADNYTQVLGPNETDHNFKFIFKVENMKLMPYNYHCKITQRGISQFTSNNDEGPKLTYWVAIEQNSEFK